MDVRGWEERYRRKASAADEADADNVPAPLVVDVAGRLSPGTALDLACGSGRNALWLARQGWQVTAVDGASTAIEVLRDRAIAAGLSVDAHIADLKTGSFAIEPNAFDLITICYYLQRNLFSPAKSGVKQGGLLLAIVHTTERDEEPTESRLRPGELRRFFDGWEILHSYEGTPNDPAHKRAVAEIVVRRPVSE